MSITTTVAEGVRVIVDEEIRVSVPSPNCNGRQEATGVAVGSEEVALLLLSLLSTMLFRRSAITVDAFATKGIDRLWSGFKVPMWTSCPVLVSASVTSGAGALLRLITVTLNL